MRAVESGIGVHVAIDQQYLSESNFAELYEKADEVARIISGFIKSLRGKKNSS